MNTFASRCFAFAIVSAVSFAAPVAHAEVCSGKQALIAKTLGPKLMKAVMVEKKYAEADAIYEQLAALDASCMTAWDHTLGGTAARKLGDLHNAYLRFRTANNEAEIRQLDGAYGVVRIDGKPATTPARTLTWPGAMITTSESGAVVDRTKALIAGPNRVVGYLPKGHYIVMSGTTTLAEFDIKPGETTTVTYR